MNGRASADIIGKQPERKKVSSWSTFFFGDGEPIFVKGVRHPLQEQDLYVLPKKYKMDKSGVSFDKIWSKECQKPHPSLAKAVVRHNLKT